jgi:hypothetical protein
MGNEEGPRTLKLPSNASGNAINLDRPFIRPLDRGNVIVTHLDENSRGVGSHVGHFHFGAELERIMMRSLVLIVSHSQVGSDVPVIAQGGKRGQAYLWWLFNP